VTLGTVNLISIAASQFVIAGTGNTNVTGPIEYNGGGGGGRLGFRPQTCTRARPQSPTARCCSARAGPCLPRPCP
jgi:hypothetical protein